MRSTVAVLGHGVMVVEIERHDEGAGVVGRGERLCFPAAGGESQRGVLKLRLGWGERHCKLAEDLSVRVQCVAGGAPRFVRQRRPGRAVHAGLSMWSRTTTGISRRVYSTTPANCGLSRAMRSRSWRRSIESATRKGP